MLFMIQVGKTEACSSIASQSVGVRTFLSSFLQSKMM